MRYVIPCPCCGELIPVVLTAVGKAVLCPLDSTAVTVEADKLQPLPQPAVAAEPTPAAPNHRRRALLVGCLAGAAVVLLAVGLARTGRRDPAGPKAAPEVAVTADTDAPAPRDVPAVRVAESGGPAAPANVPPSLAAPLQLPAVPGTTPAPTVTTTPASSGRPADRTAAITPAPRAPVVARPSASGPRGPDADAKPGRSDAARQPDADAAPPGAPAADPLARRIDLRNEAELLTELLAVQEISLDTAAAPGTSAQLTELARQATAAGVAFPGPAVAARGRKDLAGLPFAGGPAAVLHRDPAEAMNALSRKLRGTVSSCVADASQDTRPDPTRLAAALLGDGPTGRRTWAAAEAVPCVQQMLQAEGRGVRLVAVGALAANPGPESTATLAGWAVFDPDPGVRGAACRALVGRERGLVRSHLVGLFRHPWPRVAEHAAEALVDLADRDAAPALAALLTLVRPDASFDAGLGNSTGEHRREMVRVNHARNCMMCHQASFDTTDLVRGAVPDPTRALPGATTPEYYTSGSRFVRADATYLRQDFSAVQPVAAAGPWPARQRYDYMVAVRPAGEAPDPAGPDPFRAAALFALKHLLGRDGTKAADFGVEPDAAAVPADVVLGGAARAEVQLASPAALAELWMAGFGRPFLLLTPTERAVGLAGLARRYGPANARLAVFAYLDPLTRTGTPAARSQAAALLAEVRANGVRGIRPEQIQEVRALLSGDGNSAARAAALRELAAAGNLTPEDLMRLLADAAGLVRAAAAAALTTAPGHRQDVHLALAARLRDPDAPTRSAAAKTLAALKTTPDRAGAELASALFAAQQWESDAQKAEFQAAVVPLLCAVIRRAPDALPPVARAAAGDNPAGVPDAAVNKLLDESAGPAGADALAVLVTALGRQPVRDAAGRRLVTAGSAAVPALVAGLGADYPATVRATAAKLLGQVAARPDNRRVWRDAQDALVKAKADPDADVRIAVTAALTQMGAGR